MQHEHECVRMCRFTSRQKAKRRTIDALKRDFSQGDVWKQAELASSKSSTGNCDGVLVRIFGVRERIAVGLMRCTKLETQGFGLLLERFYVLNIKYQLHSNLTQLDTLGGLMNDDTGTACCRQGYEPFTHLARSLETEIGLIELCRALHVAGVNEDGVEKWRHGAARFNK